jgi:hypothetical protein
MHLGVIYDSGKKTGVSCVLQNCGLESWGGWCRREKCWAAFDITIVLTSCLAGDTEAAW